MMKIEPMRALKTYICPGCNQEIRPKVGHFVVVPKEAPDQRRHWHKPCLQKEVNHTGKN